MNAELLPPPPSFDQQQPAPVPASGEGKQPEPRKDGGKKESKPMPKWLKGIASKSSHQTPGTTPALSCVVMCVTL